MAKCSVIPIKKRKLCSADLKDEVQIFDRNITLPISGTDFDETLTPKATVLMAIQSSALMGGGDVFFDSVNGIDITLTHRFYLRKIDGVEITAEDRLKFKSQTYRIVTAEELDEQDDWLLLRCVKRGNESKAGSLR